MIFNETKNFFDQNFYFYNWSKHNNFKGHMFGGRAFFFVLFFCYVRRYPKTGFWSFKKKFPVYPSTSNIFRGMNSCPGFGLMCLFFAKPIFCMHQNYKELKFLRI